MAKKVLVTGATGQTASYVIPQLVRKGLMVRAFVHDVSKAEKLRNLGVEIVEGEFMQEERLINAARGMDVILSINPNNAVSASDAAVITKAAKMCQVPHLVRLSAIKAALDAPTQNGKNHFLTDSDIIASGVPYTILRPNFFMQNLLYSVSTIKEHGKIYWGMGQGKLSMIDVRDIADCCVSIIVNGGHHNMIYNPNGPESISFSEIANIMSERLNRTITYVPVSIEDVGESLRAMGSDEWGARLMMDYSRAYSQGWGDISNNDVEIITGRKARSFRQFFDEVMAPVLQEHAYH